MKCFRLQVSVAAEHFPIPVPGDKRDLFNGKPSFEKAAGPFAVHRGGVTQNRFDISKIDAARHGAGSLWRALFSEFDQALSIKLWKTKMPKSFI